MVVGDSLKGTLKGFCSLLTDKHSISLSYVNLTCTEK